MKLIIKDNYEKMSDWAAEHIASAINNHKGDRPFVLGLPTGSSPLGVYKRLIEMNKAGKKVALAHFTYLNPLPKNTETVLKKYKKVVVAEQNLGQFAGYLRMKIDNFTPYQFNEVKGQPFVVAELVAAFNKLIDN